MELHLSHEPSFPKLGYLGTASRTDVVLRHGSMVEADSGRSSDGAWDGDFGKAPNVTSFICGTAGFVEGDRLVLLSPQTPIDRIFVHEDGGGKIWFSNSLPLILLGIGAELDPNYVFYRSRFMAANLGISLAPREIPLSGLGRRSLRILLNETAIIQDGTVQITSRQVEPPFPSFEAYRRELGGVVERIVINAQDERRQQPLKAIPSMSAGYDSSVVAVLAAEAGITDALTLLRYEDESSRSAYVDHPEGVAQALGLTLRSVERDTWRSQDEFPSALIAASSVNFMDVAFLAYADRLPGTLLMVGHSGDNVWGLNPRTYRDIVQGGSGRGLAEHRLFVGYVIFAAPFYGHTAQRSLLEISTDRSMARWSVGGAYDRPIARRIVEEAGVPREAFARRKFAGSARVGTSRNGYVGVTRAEREAELLEIMSAAAVESFLNFIEHLEGEGKGSASAKVKAILKFGPSAFWIYEKLEAVNHRVGRRLYRIGIRALVPRRFMVFIASFVKVRPDYTYLWPHWGVQVLKSKYNAQ